ncbi:MAG: DUF309 domain-containing protein [Verrucomicrobia bacterium]|nr:DUF309 domain-containing protein [Verrucomicrobiota bacterium]MDE3099009.1 DUF309 domain-containing protein [Verrucomicrobiota bacterium]
MVGPYCVSGLDPHFAAFIALFNKGQFYEAHDVLENLWLADRHGSNGAFYKGLIQLAGAFVHVQKKRRGPSAALLKLARENLAKYASPHEGLDLHAARQWISRWLEDLQSPDFELASLEGNAPQLTLILPPRHGEHRV